MSFPSRLPQSTGHASTSSSIKHKRRSSAQSQCVNQEQLPDPSRDRHVASPFSRYACSLFFKPYPTIVMLMRYIISQLHYPAAPPCYTFSRSISSFNGRSPRFPLYPSAGSPASVRASTKGSTTVFIFARNSCLSRKRFSGARPRNRKVRTGRRRPGS